MTNRLKHFIAFILSLGVAPLASAAESVWNIYTPAAGSAIFDILSGVSAMMDRGGATSIIGAVLTVSLVSFIALVARAGIEGNFVRVLTFFLGLWVLMTATFGIKVKVMVSDRVNNYYNVVTNVPIILAAPAAFISEMGNQLADSTDKFMTMPDGLSMRQGGQFNLFSKVLADSATYKIVDPGLNQSVVNYINDCAIPGIAQGSISLTTLKTSKDLWADLQFKNAALMTRVRIEPSMVTGIQQVAAASAADASVTDTPAAPAATAPLGSNLCSATNQAGCTESLVSCTEAYTTIGAALKLYADKFGTGTGAVGDLAATGAAASLGNALSAASTWISGSGTENQVAPGSVLQQRIMLNTITGAFRSAAVQAGNSELLQAAATTQAEEAQKSAWITSASLFNDLMGYIFIVLQAMIYAIAPFALLLLFAPGSGVRGAVSYLQMLIWVALWEPLLTIVNYMIAVLGKSSMVGAFGTGFDLTNATTISESANNLMAAAGFMGSMVPLIAWKIATGALGLMEFVQQGSGQGAASQAGSTASSGNLSLGNIDLNKMNANSEKFTYGTEFGETPLMHRKASAGGGAVTTDFGGSDSKVNASQMSYGFSTGLASGQRAESKVAYAHDMAEALTLSTSRAAAETQSEIAAHTIARENAKSSGSTVTSQLSQATGNSLMSSVGEMVATSAALGYNNSFSIGGDASIGFGMKNPKEDGSGGGPGMTKLPGFTLSGGGSLGRTTSLNSTNSSSKDLKSVASQAWQSVQQVTGAVSATYNEKDGMTLTMQNGKTLTLSAQEVRQATETYSRKLESGYSESLARSHELKYSEALPMRDGRPGSAPDLPSSPAQAAILASNGAKGLPEAVSGMPKDTPHDYSKVRQDAKEQLVSHAPAAHKVPAIGGGSVSAPSVGPRGSHNPNPGPDSAGRAAALRNAAAGPQPIPSQSAAQQADLRQAQNLKFTDKTTGHVWNADDVVNEAKAKALK